MRAWIVSFVVVGLILLFGTTGRANVKDDLALYLPFDERNGDIAGDQSPNGNDGILHLVNWTDDGKYDNAVEFTGVAGGWVEVPDSPSLDITDEVSILVWVYPTQFTADYFRIVVKTYTEDVSPLMVYGIYEQGGSDGRTAFIVSIGDVLKGCGENVTPQLPLEQWTHMAATYDGAEMKIYYDGELKASAVTSGKMDTNDVPVSIGRNNVGNREHYIGLMDEVAIYSRALTQEEIKIVMAGLSFIPVEPLDRLSITWGLVKSQY